MKRILIVDWLGRGGIAQAAHEWREALVAHGEAVMVVSRAGLELPITEADDGVNAPRFGGRLGWHAAVAARARSAVTRWQPDVVVVQGSVVPTLEFPVLAAADRAGIKTILVAHNRSPHERSSGSTIGLDRLLQRAAILVGHSRYVADSLPSDDVRVIPLPVPSLVVGAAPTEIAPMDEPPTLLQFGVLRRGYKGTGMLTELADLDDFGWRFRLVGAGAPVMVAPHPRLTTWPSFVEAETLAGEVRRSAAVALPYLRASQSAAVVLCQALGRVPLATAVGGIVEQIADGEDGFLVPGGLPVEGWRRLLEQLSPDRLRAVGQRASARAAENDTAFRAGVIDLCLR